MNRRAFLGLFLGAYAGLSRATGISSDPTLMEALDAAWERCDYPFGSIILAHLESPQ